MSEFAFRDPGSVIVPDPGARCRRCNGNEHLIEGDGQVVCRVCIEELGAIANDPHVTTQRVLEALQARHGDVTTLLRVGGPNRDETHLVWDWIAPWPGVEPRRS